ncbi:hypothetical protein HYU16_02170 [Candidatus Woesearchaeota archaeon]|nr:hypothetical protein [Candidatus Woesearchaeota archaeon]
MVTPAIKQVDLVDLLAAIRRGDVPTSQVVRTDGWPCGITDSQAGLAYVGYLGRALNRALEGSTLLPLIISDNTRAGLDPSMVASLLKAASEEGSHVNIEGLLLSQPVGVTPPYILHVRAVEYRGVRVSM